MYYNTLNYIICIYIYISSPFIATKFNNVSRIRQLSGYPAGTDEADAGERAEDPWLQRKTMGKHSGT